MLEDGPPDDAVGGKRDLGHDGRGIRAVCPKAFVIVVAVGDAAAAAAAAAFTMPSISEMAISRSSLIKVPPRSFPCHCGVFRRASNQAFFLSRKLSRAVRDSSCTEREPKVGRWVAGGLWS